MYQVSVSHCRVVVTRVTTYSLPVHTPRPRLGRGVTQPWARDQGGQSMVEFALIGPIFLLVVFMVIQAGLFINARATIDNAAREGARVAAMCGGSIAPTVQYNGTSYSSCTAAVQRTVATHLGFLRYTEPNLNPVIIICSPPPASGVCTGGAYAPTQGSPIQVSVDYQYDYYFGILLGNSTPFRTDIGSDAIVVSQQ